MIEAVLFDLDGTFADTAPDLAAALNYTLATRRLPPLALETVRPHASHGSRGLLELGFGIVPGAADYDALRDVFLDYYETNICTHTRLFPGIEALLAELERRGVKWGIVTNKPQRYTVPLMRALGCDERAACIVSGDTCAQAKPHPAPLLRACEMVGIAPARCLYLGDDLRDMQAANASGMRGVIAAYGYVGNDASVAAWQAHGSIGKPTELIAFVDAG